jgi:transposase
VVKTYAPKGKTPVLALNDTKGYQYVCLASSISPEGKMYYEMRNKGFKGAEIVEYLKGLLQTTERKIMLIWDNATWHKSQEVKDFLISEVGQRLWVANTPAYSPEFNPSELIWANLKRVQIANAFAKNVTHLKKIVAKGMDFIAEKVALIKAFFNLQNYYFTDS